MDSNSKILSILRKIIIREKCVLSYDISLIEQLPYILAEQYGILSDGQIECNKELVRLFELLSRKPREEWHICELPIMIKESGVSLESFSVEVPYPHISWFANWTENKAHQDLGSVISLQKDLGIGQFQAAPKHRYKSELDIPDLSYYLRSVISPPISLKERIIEKFLGYKTLWEYYFSRWLRRKIIFGDKPTLSVGPRWLTEIKFFRQVVGLSKHIGLDLFSDDSDLVIVGDMHQMPFKDNYFNFIFMKNVIDKSYNIRLLVKEVVRVIEPSGVVVIDQVCGYGRCNPLTRTDIQYAKNLLKIFQSLCKVSILVCEDIDISGIGDSLATGETRNNARLAFQVWK